MSGKAPTLGVYSAAITVEAQYSAIADIKFVIGMDGSFLLAVRI
ncbi:hypothetical protein [Sphingobium aquiterrae]